MIPQWGQQCDSVDLACKQYLIYSIGLQSARVNASLTEGCTVLSTLCSGPVGTATSFPGMHPRRLWRTVRKRRNFGQISRSSSLPALTYQA